MRPGVFDIFTVGIGPSSSHTVGPMRAARLFAEELAADGLLARSDCVRVDLYGSLAATGAGHGTPAAVLLGLMGEHPDTVDPDSIAARTKGVEHSGTLHLLGRHQTRLVPGSDIVHHSDEELPQHANGLAFRAFSSEGEELCERTYYSVGGGAVVDAGRNRRASASGAADEPPGASDSATASAPPSYSTAADLLRVCRARSLRISEVVLDDEARGGSVDQVRAGLAHVWSVMEESVRSGCGRHGPLPGRLDLPRRAPTLFRRLVARGDVGPGDGLAALDWASLHALAVAEENASGGRVVTAPTNGAAGIVPAVLLYRLRSAPRSAEDTVAEFLLAAAAVGTLFMTNASISGAQVGCQGEIGVACSMAAAGLTETLGGTPEQVEAAAEIAMEHNLGLTCDPVDGLVQIPCIERNAMGAVTAIAASRLTLHGDGDHFVPLDTAIEVMRQTGADMCARYKETSRGGLAAAVAQPLSAVPKC